MKYNVKLMHDMVTEHFFHLSQGIEAMLEEMFPTDDSLVDGIFAGGAITYGQLEWDGKTASQKFGFMYPDQERTEEL